MKSMFILSFSRFYFCTYIYRQDFKYISNILCELTADLLKTVSKNQSELKLNCFCKFCTLRQCIKGFILVWEVAIFSISWKNREKCNLHGLLATFSGLVSNFCLHKIRSIVSSQASRVEMRVEKSKLYRYRRHH